MGTTTTQEQWNALTIEQRARGQALIIARELLEVRNASGPFSDGASRLPKGDRVIELIDLAEWLLSGKHPLADYRDRKVKELDEALLPMTDDCMPAPEEPF